MPTAQTLTTTTGTDGRIKNRTAAANVIIGGVFNWEQNKPVQVVKRLHFECTANSNSVVYPDGAYPTIGDQSFSFGGYVNLNSTAQTQTGNSGFSDGATMIVDFLISKGSNLGYPSCTGVLKDYKDGAKMENVIQTFTATLDCYGVPPAFGTVS